MRKLIISLTFFLLLLNIKSNAQLYQDWKWLHQSPQGNELRWVKMWDANTIYAVGGKGTFVKTTNGGINWIVNSNAARMSNIPLQRGNLLDAWFFDQNTGIVVGYYGSIFRTTNGGITFDSLPGNPAPANANITGIYFINNLTGYVISGLTNYRLMKTTDGGLNWNAGYGSAPPYSNPYEVYAFNENKILVLNQQGEVCITTNGGYLWNNYASGTLVNLYKVVFINQDTGFVCGDWGRCRYTTNGGYNWENMAGTMLSQDYHYFDLRYTNNTVYLTGNSKYIWKSSNYGLSWDSIPFMSPSAQLQWANSYYSSDFSVTGDTMVTVGARGSIHQTLGTTKVTHSQYLKQGSMRDIWASYSAGLVIAVGAPSVSSASLITPDQILRSTNGGLNWSVISPSSNSAADFYSIDMIDANTGFICGSRSAVYKTTNGGLNWDSLVIPVIPSGLVLSKVDFVNSQTGWIFSRTATGSDSTIFKTTNGGVNWFRQGLGTNTGTSYLIYAASMIDENTGWVLNNKPRPCRTTNGGITWDTTSLSDNYLAGALYDIQMLNALTGYCVGSMRRVYKTTNGGATPWINISYNTSLNVTNYSVAVLNPLNVAVMGTYGTCYHSTDGGVSWTGKDLLSSISDIYGSFLASNNKLYAVTLTDACIFKNEELFPTGIKSFENTIPEKFILEQNFPNPFNPSTTIKYLLPKSAFVTLCIYDILGRTVSTIINEWQTAGTYSVNWNAESMPTGVYFYKLSADGFSETKKMILIR